MNSIVELILMIKHRPAMYIGRNYISCLKAYLDGWYQRDPSNVVDSEIMGRFQDYIEDKYKVNTSNSWCDILLFHSQDEGMALELFFEEFDEFSNTPT